MARQTLNVTDNTRQSIIASRAAQASAAVMPVVADPSGPVMSVENTSRFNGRGDLAHAGYRYTRHDGEKYEGGLGPIEILYTDYWSQRRRSNTFFKRNLYARGIIRRIVGNVVNTGQVLAANPNAAMLPIDEDAADTWAENVNDLFEAWGELAEVCDFKKLYTFGQWQRVAKAEALIAGDVLVVEHHNSATGLPTYELIDGDMVQTPYDAQNKIGKSHRIDNGVEMTKDGEHVAFWVVQEGFKHKRIKATGANGRRIAWLYYGTDKRHTEARGEPLLTLVMQNIAEIDKMRDATQRKASLGAQIVGFIQRQIGGKTAGTKPFSSGAQRRVQDTDFVGDGTERRTNIAETPFGMMVEGLAEGEEIKAFTNDTTDEKFGEFEEAILRAVAWALGMPYSVLAMQFDSSYSASRGEIKEFEAVIHEMRDRDADTLLRPVYRSWLRAMVLNRRIDAPGFLAAARNPREFATYAAWTRSQWYGMVKEAVDLEKETRGRGEQIKLGALTRTKAARMLTGTSFKTNMRKLAKENQMLADAMRPILELKKEFGEDVVDEEINARDGAGPSLIELEGGRNAVAN